MSPEDIDTIRTILADYGIDDMLTAGEFESLASTLETRENIMVTDANTDCNCQCECS